MSRTHTMLWGVTLAIISAGSASAAGPASAPGPHAIAVPNLTAPETRQSNRRDVVDQAPLLAEAELDAYRAGETLVTGNQSLSAVTTGNTLNGNYTAGTVTLSDNALANFSGIGNFAINTGAQVSLQSGMNLTINISQ